VKVTRTKVENPFGQFGVKFKTLRMNFREGPEQLDYLIFFVAGVHNSLLEDSI
jgi:hypothetical protein